jgi:protoporphyrinogen oxidase
VNKKKKRKEKREKRKKGKKKKKGREGKEREIIGEKKNGLSNFLEIVTDKIYLLYYYQVIKIEDVNYIIK